MKKQKKIAMINDISGFGRCSLTVEIPILSAMKVQCCPVPTAILSNHTGFSTTFISDFTDKMTPYVDKWCELGLKFDGISSGYLGSLEQIDIVIDTIGKLRTEETMVIIDPVMGDHGKPYQCFTPEMCDEMKRLVSLADVVTPNVTEACILTDTPFKETGWTNKELLNLTMMLRMMGAKAVVITGIRQGSYRTNVILERGSNEIRFVRVKEAGKDRPGTGDIFAAVLSGDVLNGTSLYEAVSDASHFIKTCIRKSDELDIPVQEGVCFEEVLGSLIKK